MKNTDRKQIISNYKSRTVVGGIYVIRNKNTGKTLLESAQDLAGSRNRFEFAQKTGAAVPIKIQKDWLTYGAECFVFEVLEELKKIETQTLKEYAEDIKTLKEIWLEKIKPEELY